MNITSLNIINQLPGHHQKKPQRAKFFFLGERTLWLPYEHCASPTSLPTIDCLPSTWNPGLCVWICVVCDYMHTHTTHAHTHAHMHKNTNTHNHTQMHTLCACMCVCVCACVCVCVCACVYACVYEHAHFAWSNKRLDKKHTSRPYLFSLTSSSTPPHKYQVTTTLFFRSHLLPNACMAI